MLTEPNEGIRLVCRWKFSLQIAQLRYIYWNAACMWRYVGDQSPVLNYESFEPLKACVISKRLFLGLCWKFVTLRNQCGVCIIFR